MEWKEEAVKYVQSMHMVVDPEGLVDEMKRHADQGDPESILKTIDKYCWDGGSPTINVGDVKGEILDNIFAKTNPTIALEFGTYIGYSAVRMARLMTRDACHLYTIECDERRGKLAREALKFAGLDSKVTVVIGLVKDVIPKLSKAYGIKKVDFVFIDHWKTLYKPDLVELLNSGLVQEGTVVVADNVIQPGVPDYLDFVRNHPKFVSKLHEAHLQYTHDIKDGMEESLYLG